ncbi:hypothetical protein HSE3_gp045 [Bacillus phage vB_BceM-HSE3]|nr:hypothetical protein HSE3_gp045 [Bacillus phage vB_BceM-HSE3]
MYITKGGLMEDPDFHDEDQLVLFARNDSEAVRKWSIARGYDDFRYLSNDKGKWSFWGWRITCELVEKDVKKADELEQFSEVITKGELESFDNAVGITLDSDGNAIQTRTLIISWEKLPNTDDKYGIIYHKVPVEEFK